MVLAGSTKVSSGNLHIRLRGEEKGYICRKRPLTRDIIREELTKVAVPEEVIEKYFEEEDGTQTESESSSDSIYHEPVGDNWIQFGLRFRNTTSNAFIVTSINIQAEGKCGEEEFTYTGTEIRDGYCSGENNNSNYLYVIPPTGLDSAVNYDPNGPAIENLTLFFDGFTVLDGRDDPDFEYPKGCRENTTQKIAVPKYEGQLIVRGYFIGATDEFVKVDVTETVPFSLSTQAQ